MLTTSSSKNLQTEFTLVEGPGSPSCCCCSSPWLMFSDCEFCMTASLVNCLIILSAVGLLVKATFLNQGSNSVAKVDFPPCLENGEPSL